MFDDMVDKAIYFETKLLGLRNNHKNYEIRAATNKIGNRIDILAIPNSRDDAISAHINITNENMDNIIEEFDRLFYTIEDSISFREKPDSELMYYANE